jgi:GT2 family glycosyltransferase
MTLRNEAPLLTVIICTYRREDLALSAIRSVLEDASSECEILVVDQDMEGRLESRIREDLGPPPTLRYIRTPTLGLSAARNLGRRHAAGAILAFLDDDARALPGWLAGYREAFTRLPGPVMAGGRILPDWEAPKPWWYPTRRLPILGTYDIGDEAVPFPESDLPVGANFAILKSELDRLGGFNEDLGFHAGRDSARGGEDSLIGARVKASRGLVLYQPQAAVMHLIRREKLTFRYFIWRHFIEGITKVVVLDGVRPLDVRHVLRVAWSHVVSVLGSPVHLWRCARRKRMPARELMGEWMATTSQSLGALYQCGQLCRERLAGTAPAPAPPGRKP